MHDAICSSLSLLAAWPGGAAAAAQPGQTERPGVGQEVADDRRPASRPDGLHRRRQGVQDVQPSRPLHRPRLRLPDLTAVHAQGLRSGGRVPRLRPEGRAVLLRLQGPGPPGADGIVAAGHAWTSGCVHAREATKRLGNTIPFLVDAIDNRLKHALGDRNNSEFIIDPDGKIVRKRTWSDPEQVRKDLEELVGKVGQGHEARGRGAEGREAAGGRRPRRASSQKISRTGHVRRWSPSRRSRRTARRSTRSCAPRPTPRCSTRARGSSTWGSTSTRSTGPHWNNLKKPLRFELEVPEGVKLSVTSGESPKPKVETRHRPARVPARRRGVAGGQDGAADRDVRRVHGRRLPRGAPGVRAAPRSATATAAGRSAAASAPARRRRCVKRLMEGDKNADGKLTEDELPAVAAVPVRGVRLEQGRRPGQGRDSRRWPSALIRAKEAVTHGQPPANGRLDRMRTRLVHS